MAAEIKHFQIKVKGRVQGVGYRAFALRTAKDLSLKGYVKNMTDGSVLIEVEGPIELLDRYVMSCKTGPGWAHVDQVTVIEAPVESYPGFEVKY